MGYHFFRQSVVSSLVCILLKFSVMMMHIEAHTDESYPPTNITDVEIRLLLTRPTGLYAQTLSIDIPAIPVRVNTSRGSIISLGKDLTYVPGKGLVPLDPNSEEAKHIRAVTEVEMEKQGIPIGRIPLCTVVVEEKLLPRRFIRAVRMQPKREHSVDMNITVVPQEIAVFLDNNMQFVDPLDYELKLWYYHSTIVFRSISDLLKEFSTYQSNHTFPLSLSVLMEPKDYPPLTGETMVWLDMARVTAFCGVRGLQLFWELIRELAQKHRNGLFDTTEARQKDPRWVELEGLCSVGCTANLNRVLFRRPNAKLDDLVPGMVSMFAVNESTIDSELSPTIREVNSYDIG